MQELGFKQNSEAEELILVSRNSKKQDEDHSGNQAVAATEQKLPTMKPKGKAKYVSYKSPPDLAMAEIHLVL